jgi:hypothetical protein
MPTNQKYTEKRSTNPYVAPLADTDLMYWVQNVGSTPVGRIMSGLELRTALGLLDGWIPANQTWAYASATTITVPSGAASIYSVGDKLKWTANSVVLYAYVVGVADTTLTVLGNAVTNFTISANYYSKGTTPVGFPQWYAYTPSGGPTTNCTQSGRFMIQGRTCTIYGRIVFSGTPAAWTGMPSLPVTASANIIGITPLGIAGCAFYKDASTSNVLNNGNVEILASATTATLVGSAASAYSLTNTVTWTTNDAIEYMAIYEI